MALHASGTESSNIGKQTNDSSTDEEWLEQALVVEWTQDWQSFDFVFSLADMVLNIVTGAALFLSTTSGEHAMPFLGATLIGTTILAGWPYALNDIDEGRYARAGISVLGFNFCMKQEGLAVAPEFQLFAEVFASLPQMTVFVAAACLGRDIFLTGGRASNLADWLIVLCCAVQGLDVAGSCSAATQAGELGKKMKAAIELWGGTITLVGNIWTYLALAADQVAIVQIIGSVGATSSRLGFTMQLLFFWFLSGLLPVLAAPPPLPTIRPSLPKGCSWTCLLHRLAWSVLFASISPMLPYLGALPHSQRWIWPLAALCRNGMMFIVGAYVYHKKGDPGLITIDAVIMACMIIALIDTLLKILCASLGFGLELFQVPVSAEGSDKEEVALGKSEEGTNYGAAS